MHAETRITTTQRVVFRSLVDERSVLLHLDTSAYHGLNPVGTLIWRIVGDGTTFAELVDDLRGHLDEVPDTLAADVAGFLQDLAERDLVVVVAPVDG